MVLIIDNYDSFTYNLVDLVQRHHPVRVVRNDAISVAEVEADLPDGILISPGPGRPEDSGVSYPLVQRLFERVPILGICLGHQLIAEVRGGTIEHAVRPMHGKTSDILHDRQGLFRGMPSPLRVMRYHSLLVARKGLSSEWVISAQTQNGEIMGLRHSKWPVWGVQFHPESILSEGGERLIGNWLDAFAAKKAVR